MIQLGPSIKRLIETLADNYNPTKPFRFTKLDTKNGLWRLEVHKQNVCSFVYILLYFAPTKEIDDINIVVSNWL